MKYVAKQLIHDLPNTDDVIELGYQDCKNYKDAEKFFMNFINQNYELKLKRDIKDYDTLIRIELYFKKKS